MCSMSMIDYVDLKFKGIEIRKRINFLIIVAMLLYQFHRHQMNRPMKLQIGNIFDDYFWILHRCH